MKTKQKILAGILMAVLCLTSFSGIVSAETADVTLQSKIDAAKSGEIISLEKNYTESITISSDKNITIDLNGHNITTTSITVNGNLTIKDSSNSGKITTSTKDLINVDGGSLTVMSGTLENENDYAIYALNGGTVTINGGTINSLYSPLSGNNTTGAMTFKVNGGTLTATYGPAIYMPGPISLDVTGGTLNGGISLRMGKVNISGGIINAVTDNSDSPAEYYSYSGNAWLPDALYVFCGTYTSKIEGQTNTLDLNITGGTFNCKNEQGSAVAIYDLGKVAQASSIKISDSAVLNTNASNRSAYQVLSLSDIGVTSPKSEYNQSNFVGKVVSKITGGTFSSSVATSYIPEGYIAYKTSEGYEIAKKATFENTADKVIVAVDDVKDLGIKISEKSAEKYLKMISNDTSIATVENGKVKGVKAGTTTVTTTLEENNTKTIEVVVYKIDVADKSTESTNVSEQVQTIVENIVSGKNTYNLTSEQKQAIQEAVESGKVIEAEVKTNTVTEDTIKEDSKKIDAVISENAKVATYYDINVILKDAGTNQEITKLTNLSDTIKITIDVPKDLPTLQEGYTRVFSVVRVHDGKAEKLATTDNGNNTVTFETDKFSTYALSYEDVVKKANTPENNTTNPTTGDNIVLFVLIFATTITGAIIVIGKLKKYYVSKH